MCLVTSAKRAVVSDDKQGGYILIKDYKDKLVFIWNNMHQLIIENKFRKLYKQRSFDFMLHLK